jgi:hypothetical protein
MYRWEHAVIVTGPLPPPVIPPPLVVVIDPEVK